MTNESSIIYALCICAYHRAMIPNYHILIVHFPTALLSLYALMELFPFRRITAKPYWFHIKATFVILGTLSAYLAIIFGGFIEGAIGIAKPDMQQAIEVHSNFAAFTTTIFSILAGAYLVAWIESEYAGLAANPSFIGRFFGVLLMLKKFILSRWAVLLLALLGLFGIIVTGALGGAIVNSPDVDPIVNILYHLFVR